MNVASDGGYFARKTVANKEMVLFPALAGEYQPGEFDLFGTNGSLLSIEVDGHGAWSFGHTAAAQSSLVSHSQKSRWVFSDEYLASLLLSISKCISPNTHDISIDLVTGLPYRDFKQPEFNEAFKRHLLGSYTIYRDGIKQNIEIASCLRVPQAYGPIFYHLLDERGEFVDPATERDRIMIGSLNIGSNTVEVGTITIDLSALRQGRIAVDPAPHLTRSESIGVFSTLPILRRQLADEYPGQSFGDFELLKILETGRVEWSNETRPVDLSVIKANLYRNIVEGFLSNIYRDDRLGQFYAIINTGGGAHLLDLDGYHANVWRSKEPEWDTCLGYGRIAKLVKRIKNG